MEVTAEKKLTLLNLPPFFLCQSNLGILTKFLSNLAKDFIERDQLDIDEGFKDGRFSSAKKGSWRW